MNKLAEAMDKIVQAYKEEFGQDATMGNGEEIVGVFNDAVITLSKENDIDIKINVSVGTPYRFDENIFEEE